MKPILFRQLSLNAEEVYSQRSATMAESNVDEYIYVYCKEGLETVRTGALENERHSGTLRRVVLPVQGSKADKPRARNESLGTREKTTEAAPKSTEPGTVASLCNMAVDVVASTQPFEAVEVYSRLVLPVPEELQLAVMKAAFPVDKERMVQIAKLSRKQTGRSKNQRTMPAANRSATMDESNVDEYVHIRERRRRSCVRVKIEPVESMVQESMQIGFTMIGKVHTRGSAETATVRLSFDRRRITEIACSRHPGEKWCEHAVSLAIHRMDHPQEVEYRLPWSDSVQRLSEFQQKQVIGTLLSQLLLDEVVPAQRLLDSLISSTVSNVSRPGDGCKVYGVPDSTAGGGLSEDAVWCFDEQNVHDLIEEHFMSHEGISRSFQVGVVTHHSADEWVSTVKQRQRYIQLINCVNVDEVNDECVPSGVSSFASAEEVGKIFRAVTDMLLRGDPCCVTILNAVTERWMKCLECTASRQRKRNECAEYKEHQYYQKNIELLNAGELSSCLPDCITALWRSIVLCSKLNHKLMDDVGGKLTEWACRLDSVVCAGLNLQTRQRRVTRLRQLLLPRKREPRASQPFYPPVHAESEELWLGLSGWNGFKQVQALAMKQTRRTIRTLQNVLSFQSTRTDVYPWNSLYALNTAALIVQTFKACGFKQEAKKIANACLRSFLSVIRDRSFSSTICNVTKGDHVSEVMLLVNDLHDRVGTRLWGLQTHVAASLCLLLKAVESEEWMWANIDSYDIGILTDWLATQVSEKLLKLQPDHRKTVLNAVPAVIVIICCLMIPVSYWSSVIELDVMREKNKLISSLVRRLFDVNKSVDVMRDVFSPLVSLTESCHSHLDAGVMAQFLLHAILADQSGSTHRLDSDKILPAVVALLVEQGMCTARLSKQTTREMEIVAPCKIAMLSATIMMALKCYGESTSSGSLIVESIVPPLYATDRTWLHAMESDIVTIISLASGSNSHEYLKRVGAILFCGYVYSSLSERLIQLKSPAASLAVSPEAGTQRQEKSKPQKNDASELQVTAMELLLSLLQVDSAVFTAGTVDNSLRWAMLRLLSDVTVCIGA